MLKPGEQLQNRYKIERQIGEGGMGTVYIATDLRFGTKVAIKETHFTDATMRRAFEREAQLLNGLRHAALPRVSDHFSEGDGQFIVMEYIPGDDLSQTGKKGFAVAEVLQWADALLDALDYLHTQNPPILHRDIKPQNLKLTPRGEVILLDFGLAKGSVSEATQASTAKSVYGYSLSYAPLEQIKGAGTDPRTDIYSLAATLYHLLTGEPPADSITRATTLLNGSEDPLLPVHEVNSKVPIAVSEILQKALTLNPNLRPANVAQIRQELREAVNKDTRIESYSDASANDKTIADDLSSLKTYAVEALGNIQSEQLKVNTANGRMKGRATGLEQKAHQTDFSTKLKNQARSNSTPTVIRRREAVRQPAKTGGLQQLQNSRGAQVALLLLVLLAGVGATAWFSMKPAANVASNPISQTNQNTQSPVLPEAGTANVSNTQQAMTQTSLNDNRIPLPTYTATPVSYKEESPEPSNDGTFQVQPVSQPQSSPTPATPQPTPQPTPQNTPVPNSGDTTRVGQDSRPANNQSNPMDDERVRNEMKRQVDEALRRQREDMDRRMNEQRQGPPPYGQQQPPPNGRPFPPPPRRP